MVVCCISFKNYWSASIYGYEYEILRYLDCVYLFHSILLCPRLLSLPPGRFIFSPCPRAVSSMFLFFQLFAFFSNSLIYLSRFDSSSWRTSGEREERWSWRNGEERERKREYTGSVYWHTSKRNQRKGIGPQSNGNRPVESNDTKEPKRQQRGKGLSYGIKKLWRILDCQLCDALSNFTVSTRDVSRRLSHRRTAIFPKTVPLLPEATGWALGHTVPVPAGAC